jgi:hypothetical protein
MSEIMVITVLTAIVLLLKFKVALLVRAYVKNSVF